MDKTTTVYESYYSDPKNQDKKMNIYGYGAPVNGLIYVQGLPYQGQDHRTAENYQIYKDCGFNTAFPITSGNYWSEKWKDSNAKFVMNICEKVGIDKVIVLDEILRLFSLQWDGIIGVGDILSQDKKRVIRKKFKDEAELDAFVKERMSVYVSEPTFYGVQLVDEPKAAMLKAVGQVYRSIKRVCPKAFVQCNLFPLFFYYDKSVIFFNYEDDDTCDFQGLYRKYVETFLDETGADYILTDRYPYHDGIGNDVFNYYFLSFQMLNEIARERNVKLHFVVQSFGGYEGGKRVYRFPNPQEMALQIHTCLAFGYIALYRQHAT